MTSGTALRITSCRTASIEEWDSVCRECDHATFFHTHWWASVFCNAKNDRMEKAAQVVAFSDGLSALVPLTRKRFPGKLLSVYWSSPANTYGGWLSTLPLTMEHGRLLINHLLSFPDIVWRENPFNPYLNALDIPRSVEDFTQASILKTVSMRQKRDPITLTGGRYAKRLIATSPSSKRRPSNRG